LKVRRSMGKNGADLEVVLDALLDALDKLRPRAVADSQWNDWVQRLDDLFETPDAAKASELADEVKRLRTRWARAVGRVAVALGKPEDQEALSRLRGVQQMVDGLSGDRKTKLEQVAESLPRIDAAIRAMATANNADAKNEALAAWETERDFLRGVLGEKGTT